MCINGSKCATSQCLIMVQCKKCKQFVSKVKDDLLQCEGPCESAYHKKCIKFPKRFLCNGLCEECRALQDSQGELSPPQEGQSPAIAHSLDELNNKMDVVFKMEKKIEEMASRMDLLAERYQVMVEFKETAEKKISSLENKNIYLEKCNKALEERVAAMEMKEKENNVEISGLDVTDDENINNVVVKVAHKLKLEEKFIKEARRVGSIKTAETKNRPRPVVVTLTSREARNQWIKQRKTHITNHDIFGNNNKSLVYINEDLTPAIKQLFWLTKSQLKPTFKYIWIQNSRILVKKNDVENKIYNIRSETDIERCGQR